MPRHKYTPIEQIHRRCDPSTRNDNNDIWLAAQRGDCNAIFQEIRAHASRVREEINIKDGRVIHCTALHIAIHNRVSFEIIRLLLSVGADVNCVDNEGATALDTAISNNMHQVVAVLFRMKAHFHENKRDAMNCLLQVFNENSDCSLNEDSDFSSNEDLDFSFNEYSDASS